MRRRMLRSVLCLAALLLSGSLTHADPIITVDENGNGTLDFTATGGVVTPLPFALMPDPGPGGLGSTLTYDLLGPPNLTAGDVLLQEFSVGDPFQSAILDVVRFNPAGTGGQPFSSLVFYSDNVDGFDSLADTPSPPGALYPNNVTISEVGTEGANGAVYTPGPGDPGFVMGFSVTYHFISDGSAVPEPASVALLGLGVLGLAAYGWRRRTAR